MMNFARRLAPVRDTDATRAVAVLPSRYGGDEVLSAHSRAAPAGDGATRAGATRTDRVAGDGTAGTARRIAGAAPLRDEVPAQRDQARPAPGRGNVPPSSAQDRGARASSQRPADAASSHAGATTPTQATTASTPRSDDRLDAARAQPGYAAAVSIGTVHLTPSQAPAIAPRAARQPLSDAVLAELVARAGEPRPVVHVSIDRIEVRAPAAATPPAAAPRPRRTAPSVSLGEYLRQRKSAGST
jgi:hypothetical protein